MSRRIPIIPSIHKNANSCRVGRRIKGVACSEATPWKRKWGTTKRSSEAMRFSNCLCGLVLLFLSSLEDATVSVSKRNKEYRHATCMHTATYSAITISSLHLWSVRLHLALQLGKEENAVEMRYSASDGFVFSLTRFMVHYCTALAFDTFTHRQHSCTGRCAWLHSAFLLLFITILTMHLQARSTARTSLLEGATQNLSTVVHYDSSIDG